MFQPRSSRELNDAINDMVKGTKKTIGEILPKQVRLLMTDLAYVTRPEGKGELPKESVSRLKARIREIYPDPGWIVNLIKKADVEAGVAFALMLSGKTRGKKSANSIQSMLDKYLPNLKITIGPFDKGALHKAQRESKRLSGRLLVVNRKSVNTYIARKVRMLGFAKSGYANAAKSIGGARGIPGWAKRHKNAPGSVTISGKGSGLTITATNSVTYLRKALNKSDEVAALANRAATIKKDLKNKQDAKLRKRMERANRSL